MFSARRLARLAAAPLAIAALLTALPSGDATAGRRPSRAAASATAGDFTPTGRIVQRWRATNGAKERTLTQAQAVAIARRADVIVAKATQFAPHLAAIRAANRDVALLVYLNGAFTGQDRSYPEPLYAHNAQGERLFSREWQKWMMDVGNPDWAAAVAEECADDLRASGYDGCYVDMLGTAPLTDGYVSSPPINPATGAVWTKNDYVAATTAIGARVERANSSSIVVGNGLANGKRYFTAPGATAPLLNGLDGANAEGWIRGANQGATQFRKEREWLKDVDMLVHAGARGKTVLAMTKVWVAATAAQVDRWHRYALASFLLGNDGNSYFSFYSDRNRQSIAEASAPHAWDDLDVGQPAGPYTKVNGAYRRDFTKGIALVNPTGGTVTVRLPGTHTNLDGTPVTSVTLTPNTGEVLLKST